MQSLSPLREASEACPPRSGFFYLAKTSRDDEAPFGCRVQCFARVSSTQSQPASSPGVIPPSYPLPTPHRNTREDPPPRDNTRGPGGANQDPSSSHRPQRQPERDARDQGRDWGRRSGDMGGGAAGGLQEIRVGAGGDGGGAKGSLFDTHRFPLPRRLITTNPGSIACSPRTMVRLLRSAPRAGTALVLA